MSRQTVHQRQVLQAHRAPVIPPHYRHHDVSCWAVLGVVVLLLAVGFIAGVAA